MRSVLTIGLLLFAGKCYPVPLACAAELREVQFGAAGGRQIDSVRDIRRIGKPWSYTKPVRPALPMVKNIGWVRNPIDHFILARLEHEGLAPAPQADPATLLRRVTIDLIGLPPTLDELNAFLADESSE